MRIINTSLDTSTLRETKANTCAHPGCGTAVLPDKQYCNKHSEQKDNTNDSSDRTSIGPEPK